MSWIFKNPLGPEAEHHLKQQMFILNSILYFKLYPWGISLMVQWLRIHLPTQGSQVQSPVWEDLTCHWAAKPMHCNCRSPHALELVFHKQERPPQWEAPRSQLESSPCSVQLEKAHTQQWRPRAAKNKINNFKKQKLKYILLPLQAGNLEVNTLPGKPGCL